MPRTTVTFFIFFGHIVHTSVWIFLNTWLVGRTNRLKVILKHHINNYWSRHCPKSVLFQTLSPLIYASLFHHSQNRINSTNIFVKERNKLRMIDSWGWWKREGLILFIDIEYSHWNMAVGIWLLENGPLEYCRPGTSFMLGLFV